uniref:Uncharacterized protein n=1 Tax=Brugia timori TaxID=42155 RepID=A0A0R3QDY8_9BILA
MLCRREPKLLPNILARSNSVHVMCSVCVVNFQKLIS